MLQQRGRFGLAGIMFFLGILACNLPSGEVPPNTAATMIAATMAALQTNVSVSQTALAGAAAPSTLTPTPSLTNTPPTTATPQNPVVMQLALCWMGPGKAYRVVSSVKTGTPVELIGVGSIAGWYVIRNPMYHDPCWIEAKNLQIDPGFDLSGLKIFNPPPTPGPTPTP